MKHIKTYWGSFSKTIAFKHIVKDYTLLDQCSCCLLLFSGCFWRKADRVRCIQSMTQLKGHWLDCKSAPSEVLEANRRNIRQRRQRQQRLIRGRGCARTRTNHVSSTTTERAATINYWGVCWERLLLVSCLVNIVCFGVFYICTCEFSCRLCYVYWRFLLSILMSGFWCEFYIIYMCVC